MTLSWYDSVMPSAVHQSFASDRIAAVHALAATPGSEAYLAPDLIDVEAWNFVGDPLCEALLTVMRERRLMGGDIYANARSLEADGVPEAVAFFADVEAVPMWADFDAMRSGAAMAKRNPVGLLFGAHGALPFTYIDPATAKVMNSTGRLGAGGDYQRRFWETATGFVGAIDVDGMKPGGAEWQKWVRIRFLHTMIRMGILRSGRWDLRESMPIGQVPSAGTAHLFGPFRVAIIRFMGGHVTKAEENSFALMWRWIARIEGANNQLLGRTHDEQFRLQSRIHQFLYHPTEDAAVLTEALIEGSARTKQFGLPKRLHAALVRRFLTEDMMQTLPGRHFADDLGMKSDRAADAALLAVTSGLRAFNQLTRIPGLKRASERRGIQLINHVVEHGLDGVKAEYRGTPVAGVATDK